MSELQLQVGDIFYLEGKKQIRIVDRIDAGRVYYTAYSLRNGKWKYCFHIYLKQNVFMYLFGDFRVSKLKAILLKCQIRGR